MRCLHCGQGMDRKDILQIQFYNKPQPQEYVRIFTQCPRCDNINVVDKLMGEVPDWVRRVIVAKRRQLIEPMPTSPPKIDIDEVIDFCQMLEKDFHLPTFGTERT